MALLGMQPSQDASRDSLSCSSQTVVSEGGLQASQGLVQVPVPAFRMVN